MWDFYLVSCEAAFRTGEMMVFQLQVAKNRASLPLTRDYMFAAEAAFCSERHCSRTPKITVAR
jgi:cyclopropane-fatty-acyl-phospholipid synthase